MRLYWSVQDNIPLISRRCADGELRVVPTSRTSDPRPATPSDLELLRRVLDGQFGYGAYNELVRSEVVLLGRAPYMDTAYEVISDGGILGHLFFDLYEMRWYFKPLEQSIYRLGHRMEVLRVEGRRGDFVGAAGEGDPKFKLTDNGLAERVGTRYVITRIFKRRDDLLEGRSSWRKVLEVNEPCVLSGESRAIRFIWRASRERGKVIVSFSGGKDSSALLEVARRSGVDHFVYFNDTGLELPETVEFVERVGYDLLGDAGDSFWRNVGGFGPPARDYRWCCKVIKLMPTHRALRDLAPGLTLVGQRRFESSARMRGPPLWRNRWLPGFVTGAPINEWSALQTWLYIRTRGVEVNPLYDLGFDRLGCYLCPASRLSEYAKVEELHPDLWERWESFLEAYAAERGLPPCWVRYGLWRWMHPPGRMTRICNAVREPMMRVTLDRGHVRMNPHDPQAFLNLIHSLGRRRADASDRTFLRVDGEGVLVGNTPVEAVLKVGVRASLCTGCGLCAEYCDREAIRVDGKATIDPDRCVGCGVCNEVCPLSHYFGRIAQISKGGDGGSA